MSTPGDILHIHCESDVVADCHVVASCLTGPVKGDWSVSTLINLDWPTSIPHVV